MTRPFEHLSLYKYYINIWLITENNPIHHRDNWKHFSLLLLEMTSGCNPRIFLRRHPIYNPTLIIIIIIPFQSKATKQNRHHYSLTSYVYTNYSTPSTGIEEDGVGLDPLDPTQQLLLGRQQVGPISIHGWKIKAIEGFHRMIEDVRRSRSNLSS